MRTKTLLLTAALTAAGVATSMAQVYSVNVAGFINQQVPVGFSMLANHLNGSPDNKVSTVIPAPPLNTTIYKYNRAKGGYEQMYFIGLPDGWFADEPGVIDMTLGPGEGVFIDAPMAFTQTFVGEVELTKPVPISRGFQMISSVLPQGGLPLDGNPRDNSPLAPEGLNLPVALNDTVYLYDTAISPNYLIYTYIGDGWLDPDGGFNPPRPAIGQAFWLEAFSSESRTWTRNYVIGVD